MHVCACSGKGKSVFPSEESLDVLASSFGRRGIILIEEEENAAPFPIKETGV